MKKLSELKTSDPVQKYHTAIQLILIKTDHPEMLECDGRNSNSLTYNCPPLVKMPIQCVY